MTDRHTLAVLSTVARPDAKSGETRLWKRNAREGAHEAVLLERCGARVETEGAWLSANAPCGVLHPALVGRDHSCVRSEGRYGERARREVETRGGILGKIK